LHQRQIHGLVVDQFLDAVQDRLALLRIELRQRGCWPRGVDIHSNSGGTRLGAEPVGEVGLGQVVPSVESCFGSDCDGTALTSAPPAPTGRASALRRLNTDSEVSIGADTCLSGSGERMDLGYTVSIVAGRLP